MALDIGERYERYDVQETWDVFGIAPRGIEEMVKDCIRWLLYIGEIKPKVAEKLAARFPPDPAWATPTRSGKVVS